MSMRSLPEPPNAPVSEAPRLVSRKKPLWTLYTGDEILPEASPHSSARFRFDPANGEFPVRYAHDLRTGPWAEIANDGRITMRHDQPAALWALQPRRPLRLVPLDDIRFLSAYLLDRRISSGNYGICQRWSAWLHAHYPAADGIRYEARKAGGISICLFTDRCRDAIDARQIELITNLEDDLTSARRTYFITVLHELTFRSAGTSSTTLNLNVIRGSKGTPSSGEA
jgi:hypothetical protein